ncbi:hypothetical protein GCM10009630_36570 [Kribbella jejuensis]|uniref:Uncharacterized protein n=1 Tax=Kribbella jejuensis TaxID=236068 RepID=A0A542EST4_9ACTN|nr:hypothetical protein [Kribbella jejuensis]TQJ18391.1 hypothetical protein FB475_2526 [Kribbella jejuensis]
MTAQHHDVQHETPAEVQATAPEQTDPLGPITLPMRYKVGARALALVGVVGLSAAAAAVVMPDGLPFGTI